MKASTFPAEAEAKAERARAKNTSRSPDTEPAAVKTSDFLTV
jgi:hypothetical protein